MICVVASMSPGRLGFAQVALLARLACHPRAGKHFAGSERLLVEDAQRLEYEDFREVCDHWLNLADLDGADQDEAMRHYLRNGCCITDSDGMTHLDAQFAGVQGGLIKEVFDRYFQAETLADWEQARNEHGPDATHADLRGTTSNVAPTRCYAIFARAASADPDAKSPDPVVEILVDEDTAETLLARAVGADHEPIDPRTYRSRRCHDADGDPVAPADAAAALLIGQLRRVVVDSKSRGDRPGAAIPVVHRVGSHRRPVAVLAMYPPRLRGPHRNSKSTTPTHAAAGPTSSTTPTSDAAHNRFRPIRYTTWRDQTAPGTPDDPTAPKSRRSDPGARARSVRRWGA